MGAEGNPQELDEVFFGCLISPLVLANADLGDADLDAFLDLIALVTLCKGLVNLEGIDTSSSAFPDTCEPVGIVMIVPAWESLLAFLLNQVSTVK